MENKLKLSERRWREINEDIALGRGSSCLNQDTSHGTGLKFLEPKCNSTHEYCK